MAGTLKVTYKTAWFMEHRLREAMRAGDLSPMGGSGKIVEIDETLQGRVAGAPDPGVRTVSIRIGADRAHSVERDGQARSFHINNATMATSPPRHSRPTSTAKLR